MHVKACRPASHKFRLRKKGFRRFVKREIAYFEGVFREVLILKICRTPAQSRKRKKDKKGSIYPKIFRRAGFARPPSLLNGLKRIF